MLTHPQFDPIAVSLGPLAIRWYGLTYVVAFVLFIALGRYRAARDDWRQMRVTDVDDLLLYGVLGVILGGRLGYVLFYKPDYYLANLAEIIQVWKGGLSFHGGFLGVVVALSVFAWRRQKSWFTVIEFVAPLVPLGFASVRIGNFINGELPGRVIADPQSVPWSMWFPQHDPAGIYRHPSQIYQALGEGLLLGIILWWFSARPRPRGAVAGLFLLGYGSLRFIAEYWRAPDAFLGLLALGFSMGQWLSLPMILAGAAMLIWAYRTQTD